MPTITKPNAKKSFLASLSVPSVTSNTKGVSPFTSTAKAPSPTIASNVAATTPSFPGGSAALASTVNNAIAKSKATPSQQYMSSMSSPGMSVAEYQAATAGRQQTPDAPMTPDQQAKYDYALTLANPQTEAGGSTASTGAAPKTPAIQSSTTGAPSKYQAAFDSYLASLTGDGGKAAIYDEAAKTQADYAKRIAEVGQLGAGAVAGDLSTGTNVVGSGNAAIASQSASARMSALSDAQDASLKGAEFQAGAIDDELKSKTDIAKARLDFEKSLIPEAKDNKPFIVGDTIYQLNPETGEYSSIGSKDKSITDQYGTGAIGEYNFAKANGYTGSFSQYQNEDANRKARASGSGSLSPTEQRLQEKLGQEDDIASAIIDFKTQMETKNWKGANPEAYKYYRDELTRLYGAAAALELDKAMKDAEIEVDRR